MNTLGNWSPEDGDFATFLANWIEEHSIIQQGRLAGQPFWVLPWQEQFLQGIFADGIDEGGLSVARGNGKTTFCAAIASAAIDGPLMQPHAQVLAVASSFRQAKILFGHVLAFGGDRYRNRKKFRVLDNNAHALVENKETKTVFEVIASDPKRAHGFAPSLILADEPAQWESRGDAMRAALMTARGKIPGCRFIALGTRAASDLHWFNTSLDQGAEHGYYQSHHAKDLEAIESREEWDRANPSLEWMPDLLKVIEGEAVEAAKNPALLAAFQALRLNGGVSDVANRDLLVEPSTWRNCSRAELPPREGLATWGVDLGGSAAMSAIAACWPNGRIETLAMFGREPDLKQRALQDSVGDLYQTSALTGELIVSAHRVPRIDELFTLAEERFGGRPEKIVCDTWRIPELRDALEAGGWTMIPLVRRRQGYKDGGEDVRAFRKAAVSIRVRPAPETTLLTASLGEAVTVTDPAGNSKLAKDTEGGRRKAARDDLAAAAILAVAHGLPNEEKKPTTAGLYGGIIGG